MEVIHPCCCGLDVHAKTVVVCLIRRGSKQTRTFSTMTDDLLALNFSDGLLSLLGNVVFILTFNHEVSQINPALTRPGRCLGQLTVGLLGRDQAQGIAGFDLPDDRGYTLAEAYEMRRVGHPVSHPVGKARRKAGLV